MNDWNYAWLTEASESVQDWPDPVAIASGFQNLHLRTIPSAYYYTRARWEPRSDGIAKACTEMLGYMIYNPDREHWNVWYRDGDDWLTHHERELSWAKSSIENFFNHKLLNA